MAPSINADILNALCALLDCLNSRFPEEDIRLANERKAAKDNTDLLAGIDRRQEDIRTARKMHTDARNAYMAAVAAYEADPALVAAEYAKAFALASGIEDILAHRGGSVKDTKVETGTGTTGDKPATSKTDGKGAKDDKSAAPASDVKVAGTSPAPKGDEVREVPAPATSKDKTGDKGGKDDSSTNAILAAIEAAQQKTVAALEPRLINADLAEIINSLTPEQLKNALNRAGLNPRGVALINTLDAYTPEELARLLQGLNALVNGSLRDRVTFPWGARNAPSNNTVDGSHR